MLKWSVAVCLHTRLLCCRATRLKELRLSWCGVGPGGCAALADAIAPVVVHPAVPTEQPKLTLLDLTVRPG